MTKKFLDKNEVNLLEFLQRVEFNGKRDALILVESVENKRKIECLFSEIVFEDDSLVVCKKTESPV